MNPPAAVAATAIGSLLVIAALEAWRNNRSRRGRAPFLNGATDHHPTATNRWHGCPGWDSNPHST